MYIFSQIKLVVSQVFEFTSHLYLEIGLKFVEKCDMKK